MTSELTVRINENQKIRYLANHVISGTENIPKYQYRIGVFPLDSVAATAFMIGNMKVTAQGC